MNKQLWSVVTSVVVLAAAGSAQAQATSSMLGAWQLAGTSALGLQLPVGSEYGTRVVLFSPLSLYQQIATLGVADKSIPSITTAQITRSYFGANPSDTVLRVGVQIGMQAADLSGGSALPRLLRFTGASNMPSYSLLASVSRPFATPLGTLAVGGSASYGVVRNTVLGATERSRTVFQGGVDAALKFSPTSQIGLAYNVESALEPGSLPQRNLSATYGYQFTPGLKMLVSVSRDLSRSLLDPAVGLSGGVLLRYSY